MNMISLTFLTGTQINIISFMIISHPLEMLTYTHVVMRLSLDRHRINGPIILKFKLFLMILLGSLAEVTFLQVPVRSPWIFFHRMVIASFACQLAWTISTINVTPLDLTTIAQSRVKSCTTDIRSRARGKSGKVVFLCYVLPAKVNCVKFRNTGYNF